MKRTQSVARLLKLHESTFILNLFRSLAFMLPSFSLIRIPELILFGPLCLCKQSFKVPAGKHVAIVGASGSG